MQPQIGEGEVHLPQGCQSGIEGAAFAEFVHLVLGQRFSGLPVAGHAHQGALVQTPVLHELTGKFHRIPLHIADAGGFRFVDGGEHVLQTMAEFVEEGLHLFEAHQAGGLSNGGSLVADQIRHGQHQAAVTGAVTPEALVHPGSTAFAGGTAVRIQIKRGDRFATTATDVKETHVVMPHRRLAISRRDLHIKQT